MHDPKFERAVQDKMEQLEFIPSDSVWENIELAVAQRRRRAAPVFFWFLLAGLFLAGTGTAIYLRTNTPSVVRNMPIPAGTDNTKNAPPTADAHGVTESKDLTSGPAASGEGSASAAPAAADQPVAGAKAFAGTKVGARPTDAGLSADDRGWTTTSRRHSAMLKAGNAMLKAGNATPKAGNATPKTGATPAADATDPANAGSSAGTGATIGSDPALAAAITTAARQHSYYQPGLISCVAALSGIKGPRLSPLSATKTAITGIPMPKRPWSAGFAGGFGISSYNQSLLSKATTVTAATSVAPSTAYAYTRAINSSATSSKKTTSTIEPGLSYWAGIVAQKQLSKRWSLSLGADLHYYSSSLHVGGVVTTYSQSANALIGAPAVAPVQSYPYYSVGDAQVYTNRYYYLELPVAMQWQINRGRVWPLFLRGGLVLSRLMSSNGLYYNNESAVYFKDNSVIQPMQVSLTSGLVAALPVKGIRIQAGPELQYGATTLLKGGAGNGHLLYGGLLITVMR